MDESNNNQVDSDPTKALPFVAPCRILESRAPINWVRLGWQDFRRAPKASLSYGILLVALSYLVTFLALTMANFVVFLALFSGFIFICPILAMAFYEISLQLQRGIQPSLVSTLRASLSHMGDQLVFTLILVVVFMVWARVASMVHIFFPDVANPSLLDLATFLSVGSILGSLFALLVFCLSAYSLPMIVERKTDTITAVITSFNAVLRNKGAMVVWVMLIIAAVALGAITGFLGFAITLPVIGHATLHAFQDTIDASAWPKNESMPGE